MPQKRKLAAYLLPIALFILLLAVNSALKKMGGNVWLSLTHAIANLLLGRWIVNTQQWGFW